MKLIKIILLLCVFNLGFSQQNYYEEWYSADTDDLPQNSIKSIISDKYGFIWMTTENGLLRYDGRKFKVFNSYNSNIKSNRLTYISGNIQNDSLKTKTTENNVDLLINQRKITISKGANDYNAINSYENQIYYNNYLNAPNVNFLNSKIICQNENYYLIDKEKITLFDKKNKIIKELNHPYQESTIYFLYENELILLHYKKNTCSFFNDNLITNDKIIIPENSKIIYNYLAQQLFICTDNGISLFKKTKNNIFLTPLFLKQKLNLNIKSLYLNPKSNKLFIGTIDRGLNIITPNRFRTLLNSKTINNNFYGITPISEDEFVTSRGEIFNLNGMVGNLNNNKNENENFYLITVDLQKNIWIPNGTKIFKYLKSTNYKTSQIITLDGRITSIYCDSKNKVWIGVENTTQKETKIHTIDAKNGKLESISLGKIKNSIVFFTENNKHEILMACDGALIIFNPEKRQSRFYTYKDNNIRSIFIDKENLVWICTYNNGFSLFKDNKFYKMPFDKKMYLLSAHCIEEDKKGNFWISTNKGLIEVNKQSLLSFYNKNTPVYYHHFDMKDGFLTNEFNGGCQPCSMKFNNQFIFPSLNGMVYFNPETIKTNLQTNDFYINEVELDEETQYFKDTIQISRDVDRIKFKIDCAYFGNLDNINFEAKLQSNSKQNWINLKNENEIIFTNLPPGNHQLYIRKITPFTSKYATKKITIIIPYFFYELLWFKILSAIMTIAIIVLVIRLRYRIIERKNIELEKKIKERTSDLFDSVSSLRVSKNNLKQEILQQKKLIGTISHDIKSPLKFLTITAKHLYEKSILSEDKNIKDHAKIMNDSALELYKFVENLVDYSKVFIENHDAKKSKKENIDIVINEKINLFKNIATGNKVEIIYKNFVPFPIEFNKKVLGIIMHNLLDNAVKNTLVGNITIEVNLTKTRIYISVEDTGIGMKNEIKEYYMKMQKNYETDKLVIQNYGLGLHMVLELLRMLKGELLIESKEGKGTIVTLICDTNNHEIN